MTGIPDIIRCGSRPQDGTFSGFPAFELAFDSFLSPCSTTSRPRDIPVMANFSAVTRHRDFFADPLHPAPLELVLVPARPRAGKLRGDSPEDRL